MIRITVLLATLNGARYLSEQLDSIAGQDVEAGIDVVASDDGSTDGTLALLAEWQGRWTRGAFTIQAGPGRGFSENFRSLMARPLAESDYAAFSDQDDVWLPDKFSVALAAIGSSEGPALYCSRTLIVGEQLQPLGRSPHFRRAPHFRNALVQSIAGANTMVMNRPAFALVSEAARRTPFVAHDWWCYMMISGAGGDVVYDAEPRVMYRQHDANAIGQNTGPKARWRRLRASLGGQFQDWNRVNIQALQACRDLLSREAGETLEMFVAARRAGGWRGLYLIWRAGLYRQLPAGNISLALAALLRKL